MTSTLLFGEGDLDLGGNGDPPVDDPSGDGRSIDGEGEGEGLKDLGDVRTMELLLDDLGVSGLDAPGDIDVGLGDSKLILSVFSGISSCTGEGGEEIGEDADAVDEDVEDGEAVDIWTSPCSEDCGDNELSGLSSGSSSVEIQLSSCSCITLSSICRTRSFSGDRSSSSSVSTSDVPDSLLEDVTVTSPLLVMKSLAGLTLSK